MKISLERIFNPHSVAVMGVSEIPGKEAERRTRSLIKGGIRERSSYKASSFQPRVFSRMLWTDLCEIPTTWTKN